MRKRVRNADFRKITVMISSKMRYSRKMRRDELSCLIQFHVVVKEVPVEKKFPLRFSVLSRDNFRFSKFYVIRNQLEKRLK